MEYTVILSCVGFAICNYFDHDDVLFTMWINIVGWLAMALYLVKDIIT